MFRVSGSFFISHYVRVSPRQDAVSSMCYRDIYATLFNTPYALFPLTSCHLEISRRCRFSITHYTDFKTYWSHYRL